MISLFHENQIYRRLLPWIVLYLLLRFFIEQVVKLVKHSAKLKFTIYNDVLLF